MSGMDEWQQRENERLARLPKRLVFTDGLQNPYCFQGYADGVYAIIGPFAGHISDLDFQDELTELCRKYNRVDQIDRKRPWPRSGTIAVFAARMTMKWSRCFLGLASKSAMNASIRCIKSSTRQSQSCQ